MNVADFDYPLTEELIARFPAEPRDGSRLLVLERATGRVAHRRFRDLPEFLRPHDLLLLNDSRVIPARLFAHKSSGAKIEILLLEEISNGNWSALLRPARRIKPGERLIVARDAFALRVIGAAAPGNWLLEFETADLSPRAALERFGRTPLPPYILRARKNAPQDSGGQLRDESFDREHYQTVYAAAAGSVAAPTAGLHFTPELLQRLRERGVAQAFCTLHVGPGTFQPIKAARIEKHRMHREKFSLAAEACAAIENAKSAGGRVVCVGTTAVRVLETLAREPEGIRPCQAATELLIRPGFKFRATDALITNFHLPRSTLLLLVCAFAGRENILAAYAEAIREQYRFYSYGDAMLIL